jgi:hypothetical protein
MIRVEIGSMNVTLCAPADEIRLVFTFDEWREHIKNAKAGLYDIPDTIELPSPQQ